MRALLVVDDCEGAEQGLKVGECGGLVWLGAEPVLHGLLERLDFPWVWGWFGLPFFCLTPRRRSSCSRPLRPPRPPDRRVVKTMPSVKVEAGTPAAAASAR